MSVYYHLGKGNVVADALSRLSMGSVAHVEDKRKDSGVTVQNGAESSLVVYLRKSKRMMQSCLN